MFIGYSGKGYLLGGFTGIDGIRETDDDEDEDNGSALKGLAAADPIITYIFKFVLSHGF